MISVYEPTGAAPDMLRGSCNACLENQSTVVLELGTECYRQVSRLCQDCFDELFRQTTALHLKHIGRGKTEK